MGTVRARILSTLTVLAVVVPLGATRLPAAAAGHPETIAGVHAEGTSEGLGQGGKPDLDHRFSGRRPAGNGAQRRELRDLGDVAVGWSATGTPHSLSAKRGALTGPSAGAADSIARGFLRAHQDLFGLDASDVAGLRTTLDAQTKGGTYLRYQQTHDGRDVYGATYLTVLDPDGRILSVGGDLVPSPGRVPADRLSAEDAVAVAAEDLNPQLSASPGRRLGQQGRVSRFANTLAVDDLDAPDPVEADLVNVATDGGLRPAWRVRAEVAGNADYVELVDAGDGSILVRQNQVTSDNHGTVFTGTDPDDDPVRHVVDFSGWVDTGGDTTKGNNTNTYQDAAGDDTGDTADQPHSANREFDYAWTDPWGTTGTNLPTSGADRDAVVTQLFYYTNWYHDYVYNLGFTEAFRNFQNDNFGNGGAGGDAVEAESDANYSGTQCKDSANNDIKCLNNANFNANGADGTKPRMQMYVGLQGTRYTQRANNRDTVIHEYTHGVSGRIISNGNLAGGLQSGALGEGWGDALATSINNDPVYGEYNNGDTVKGIRSTAYDKRTWKYGNLCWSGCEVHDDGEVWASIMWDARRSLIEKYPSAGQAKHERLMVQGMRNTVDTPSFHDARNGYLQADALENPTSTPGVGQNWCRLWKVFADDQLGEVGTLDADDDGTPNTSTETPDACETKAAIASVADTPEGSTLTFDSSGSTTGGDAGDTLAYAWDLDNDGQYDDSTKASPKWAYGDNGPVTVGLQVTNSSGYTSTATRSFQITNVAPTVTVDPSQLKTALENQSRGVSATFTDPGWLDTYTSNVSLGTSARPDVTGTVTVGSQGGAGPADAGGATPDSGTTTATITYGDNGSYTVTVGVTDDDGGPGSAGIGMAVSNVAPTSTMDKSGQQTYGPGSFFVLKAGQSLAVPGSSTDPGSDDLTFTWDWDGSTLNGETPSTQKSRVNPPNDDPAPSPTIQPRTVSTSAAHTYGAACLYTLDLRVTDDEAGTAVDSAKVLITGNGAVSKGHGWWLNQYREKSSNDFSPPRLQCYLDIVNAVSLVFSERKDADSRPDATLVLNNPSKPTADVIFDQQALGAWLNFANGSVRLSTPVDSDGNETLESTFGATMLHAEQVRTDPLSTSAQIKAQKDVVERIATQSGP